MHLKSLFGLCFGLFELEQEPTLYAIDQLPSLAGFLMVGRAVLGGVLVLRILVQTIMWGLRVNELSEALGFVCLVFDLGH